MERVIRLFAILFILSFTVGCGAGEKIITPTPATEFPWMGVQMGGGMQQPLKMRPSNPNSYCETSGTRGPATPPTPFLYQPFEGIFEPENWTAQMDHDRPTYQQNGVIATLGETLRYDTRGPGLAGGTEVYQASGKQWFGPDKPYDTLLRQGYFILAYQSPSFETYLYYDGHDGHDFAVTGKVLAAAGGGIVFKGDYGNALGRVVEIYHPNGYLTRYAHLASFERGLEVGSQVKAGQPIGTVGGSAVVDGQLQDNYWGVHLHFSVFRWDGSKWRITDPFGWDPWAGPDQQSHIKKQREDPLVNCNGEISYNLWVDGWPRPYESAIAVAPFSPTQDRYLGGWLGEMPSNLAPQAPPPSPAIATDSATLLLQAEQAMHDGDYYIAAAILHNILSAQPDLASAQSDMQQVASRISGGLVIDGNPGYYLPFTRQETVPIPNWPQNANHLVAVSSDGRRGIFTVAYNNVATFIVDFATGAMSSYDRLEPIPSPNLNFTIRQDFWNDAKVYDFQSDQEITLCAPYNSEFYWGRDNRTIVGVYGNDQTVYIMDVYDGTCSSVHIPGADWGVEIFTDPQRQKLLIITPGSFSSMEKAKLLIANLDGTGIKKITDLPFAGRDSERSLIAPDGSAIYLEGYIISTRTGQAVQFIPEDVAWKAVAWIDQDLPTAIPMRIQLSSSPAEGPRGTRFSFSMQGGPAGQEISWAINTKAGQPLGSYPVAGGKANLDQNGDLNDANGQFGWSTDINTEAGTYYLTVYINRWPIAETTFKVTEP